MRSKLITTLIIGASALTLTACSNQDNHDTNTNKHATSETTKTKSKTSKSSFTSNKSSLLSSSQTSSNSMSSSVSSSVASKTENVSDKQIGTMVGFLISPDWFKEYLNSNTMYYGKINHSNGKDGEGLGNLTGYSYISAHGDSASFIYYKCNGDDITIKYNAGGANGPFITKHASYNNLLKDYYQTQDQKNEVNAATNKMQNDPAGYMG